MSEDFSKSKWTFLSNHSHVLICLARYSSLSLREVAAKVGITERSVQNIVQDLEEGGFLKRIREGRSNRYELDLTKTLRHPLEGTATVAELVNLSEH